MKKLALAASAVILAGSIQTADAQYRHRGHGGHGYRHQAVSYGYGGYPAYGYGYRRDTFNGGALAAGLISSIVLCGLLPGLGGLSAAGYGAYGQPYGAYDPYSYGYQPGYAPYPVVYRPIRQRVVSVPRTRRVHMRARMVPVRRAVYH